MECAALKRLGIVGIAAITNIPTLLHADPPPPVHAPQAVLSSTDLTRHVMLYLPSFDVSGWSGDLTALTLDNDGEPDEQRWSAAAQLTAGDWRERILITRRDDTGANIPFREFADLSPGQQDILGDQTTVDYLRGSALDEGVRFRFRGHRNCDGTAWRNILGAIIHGNPVIHDYGDTRRLFVNANDGMMHAFDADDGTEAFAYMPACAMRRISMLVTSPADTQPHYTVDGALTLANVIFQDDSDHTLLIGTLGSGGQGMFALDVTRPVVDEQDALSAPLWEFTDDDADALGLMTGKPSVAILTNGRHAVIIGNGYESDAPDIHPGPGTAQLLVIDSETGELIKRLDTHAGTPDQPNGMSSVRNIDSDADGRIDFVYAGDLHGNLWRFDISDPDPAAWRVGCGGAPLFSARDDAGHAQVISTAPVIIAHATQGVWVIVGTGDTTAARASGNSIYGVRDRLEANCPATEEILQQTLSGTSYGTGIEVRTLSNNESSTPYDVWHVELPDGEGIVTDPAIIDGNVIVTSQQQAGHDPGAVWLMQFDARSGGAPDRILYDMNRDGMLDVSDNVDGNDDGDRDDAEDRVMGWYPGKGLGAAPVFGNLSAERRIAYVNRIDVASNAAMICPDAPDTNIDDDTDDIDPPADIPNDQDPSAPHDTILIPMPTSFPGAGDICGTAGCLPQPRKNPGRTAWKEMRRD